MTFLFDVNLLMALLWESHEHQWFDQEYLTIDSEKASASPR